MAVPMQMASHGFIVIAPDHMEGNCAWTTDKDGMDIWFDEPYQFCKIP
jgi:predicted dienelactone hydrolase